MTLIELRTLIAAPIERCFDLSRSIDLHMASTGGTGERAVDGVISGLIGFDQQVTWNGRHFGIRVFHTSRITAFERPTYFQDCMVRGMFRRFCHDHFFESQDDGTVMRDHLEFSAPFGWIGAIVEKGILAKYMSSLLKRRNAFIKKVAESQEWVRYLSD